jgi:ATP-dependent Lhr-like helicase
MISRWGFASKALTVSEEIPGGFHEIYPTLRSGELAGRLQRGYFIEELGGAQFFAPEALELLRSATQDFHKRKGGDYVLGTTDPVCVYGNVVPWKRLGEDYRQIETGALRRRKGAYIVVIEGHIWGYFDTKSSQLLCFDPNQAFDHGTTGSDGERISRALRLLRKALTWTASDVQFLIRGSGAAVDRVLADEGFRPTPKGWMAPKDFGTIDEKATDA